VSSTTVYTCQPCGETFPSAQALGGHSTKHKHETPPPVQVPDGFAGELFNARRQLVESFRPRINELDAKINEAQAVVDELKAQRREVDTQLRRLDPDAAVSGPKPKPAPESAWGKKDAEKLDVTRAFLSGHKDALGEFTSEGLYRAMRDANVTPLPSGGKLREFLPRLRDEGTIRAHQVVKGGGMAYVVVANSNGASK